MVANKYNGHNVHAYKSNIPSIMDLKILHRASQQGDPSHISP